MKTQTLLFLSSFLFLIACGTEQTSSNDETTKVETEYNIPNLELDNGAHWQANIETTDGIFTMIELMDSFSDKEAVPAYNELAESLTDEFNDIFKNCTMVGESHNQLHNYLLPLKEIIEGLRSSELNICRSSFADLERHLGQYFDFFENEH